MADGWHVTSQQQRNAMLPGGRFEEVVDVHFLTTHGVAGTVTVPLGVFNAEEVKRRVDERVAQIDAVHNL